MLVVSPSIGQILSGIQPPGNGDNPGVFMKTAVWKEGRRQSDEKLLKDKNDRKEMESRRVGEKKVAGWLVHRDRRS
ncbi:MAG: hypothetical protein V2A78_11660 [bacterium]